MYQIHDKESSVVYIIVYNFCMDKKTAKTCAALGVRIRELRQAAGMSQRALSDVTGLTQGFISRIETGQVDLCVSSLLAIARGLDVSLPLLFKG